jgi:drug/metabolite transporter (DMT)-like permease
MAGGVQERHSRWDFRSGARIARASHPPPSRFDDNSPRCGSRLVRITAYLILLATLALWTGNWVVARAVRNDILPAFAIAGRALIAFTVLAPFALPGLPGKLRALGRRDWGVLAVLGFFGGGLHVALQWLGLHYTTATSGTLFLSTTPIFILLLAAPLLHESIRARQWIGVAISFCGIALIAAQGKPARLASLSLNVGDLLAAGSMAMWATYTVVLRLRRDPLDTAQYLSVICLFGLAWLAPWVAWELVHAPRVQLDARGLAAVAYSGIGSLLIAYAGWGYVVTRLGAARAGVTMHLMPALGVLLAAIFLGEYPRWYHFAGIALILTGVALASMRRRAIA